MSYNMYWYGMLTTGNIEQVAKLLHELLDGKFYTAITAHPTYYPGDAQRRETHDVRMDVRTSQKLTPESTRDGKAIMTRVNDEYGYLSIHDTFGVYMIDTKLQGEIAVHDCTYQNPYITFEGNRVTIRHRAPAGNVLVWTFAVEDHDE